MRDQCPCLEIVRKAESLDVLLQTRRHCALVTPEVVACKLWFHLFEQRLDLHQFLPRLGGCLCECDALIGQTVDDQSVQEEYDFLGDICDIATALQPYTYEPECADLGQNDLDEPVSSVVVVVQL